MPEQPLIKAICHRYSGDYFARDCPKLLIRIILSSSFDYTVILWTLVKYDVLLGNSDSPIPGVFTISYNAKWLIAGDCFINSDIG